MPFRPLFVPLSLHHSILWHFSLLPIETSTWEICRSVKLIWGMTDGISHSPPGPTKLADVLPDSPDCICDLLGSPTRLPLRTVRYSP